MLATKILNTFLDIANFVKEKPRATIQQNVKLIAPSVLILGWGVQFSKLSHTLT